MTIASLRGNSVSSVTPVAGQGLIWDGAQWAGGSLPNQSVLVFRPGGVAQVNVFTSWADLITAFSLTKGPVTVAVDDSIAAASADVGITDFDGRAHIVQSGNAYVTLTLPDNAVLHNLGTVQSYVTLDCLGTSQPNLTFSNGRIFSVLNGGIIRNYSATQPVIEVPVSQSLSIVFNDLCLYDSAGAMPMVHALNTGSLSISVLDRSGPNSNNFISGIAGSVLGYSYSASTGLVPSNPNFAGTATYEPVDLASQVYYFDAVPPLGSSTVQGAISALKGYLGGKIHWLVVGGAYPTFQDAINACVAGDTIMVGPVVTVGTTWGNGVFPDLIPINVVGLSGSNSLSCAVGLISFSPVTGLGIDDNGVWLQNVLISADFTLSLNNAGVVFMGSANARLRLDGCTILNTGIGGSSVLVDNVGLLSNCYLENCQLRAPANVSNLQVLQNTGYSRFTSCLVSGGIGAVSCNGGSVDFDQSRMEYSDADPTHSVIKVSGGLVYCQGSFIQNNSAGGNGVYLQAGGVVALDNTVVDVAVSLSPGGYCVWGGAGTTYAYGQVTYSNSVNVQNTVTIFAVPQVPVPVP